MFFLKQISISRRLILNFGLAALFTSIASGLAILTFIDSKDSLAQINTNQISQLKIANQISLNAQAIAAQSRALTNTASQVERQKVYGAITKNSEAMENYINDLERLGFDGIDFKDLKTTKKNLLEVQQWLDVLIRGKIANIEKEASHEDAFNNITISWEDNGLLIGNEIIEPSLKDKEILVTIEGNINLILKNIAIAFGSTDQSRLLSLEEKIDNDLSSIKEYSENISDTQYRQKVDSLLVSLRDITNSQNGIFSNKKHIKSLDLEIKTASGIYIGLSEELMNLSYSIIITVESNMQDSIDSFNSQLIKNGAILVVISIACILFAIALAFRIGKNIGRRIEILQESMMQHAQGIRGRIPSEENDEIGQMASSLRVFIEKIAQREDDLQAAKDEVSEKLEQLELAQKALKESEIIFKDYANISAGWFWEMGADLRFTMSRGHALNVAGIKPEDVLEKTLDEFMDDAVDKRSIDWDNYKPFEAYEFSLQLQNGTKRYFRMSGKPLFDDNNFCGYRGTGIDITEEYLLSEKLNYQANHDALTGLLNRHGFEKYLTGILDKKDNMHGDVILFVDLDRFKIVNDTAGHPAGDELLVSISKILKDSVRSNDTVSRLGGDEFSIILKNASLNNAQLVADNICKIVKQFKFCWNDKVFTIGASIGLVQIHEKFSDIAEVMKAADSACYAAKDQGRGRVYVYNEKDAELLKRNSDMLWLPKINSAIENNAFALYAQPISSLQSEQGLHYEVLLRIADDDGSLIYPNSFLPAAERHGLMPAIDLRMIENVFAWLQVHPKHTEDLYQCNINLSPNTLSNSSLLNNIQSLINQYEVATHKICFEITETTAIANPEKTASVINQLKSLGFKFALDDFGNGFSWFGSMNDLPVEYLKIDGAFVKDIDTNPIHRAMVSSINDIGRLMNKKTVAEFAENDEIVRILRDMKVDYAQGYAIAKPMQIDLLDDYLKKKETKHFQAKI